MPEYLSPGIYVEEFDSGNVPISGVSTSTAGFVGLSQRGKVIGLPELVTSFADFVRKYGSYLSELQFGEYRYLAYAVEQFFLNGGSRAYIMRCIPENAKTSSNNELGFIKLQAKNPGAWGDRIRVLVKPSSKAKSGIVEDLGAGQYKFKNIAGFNEGDIIELVGAENSEIKQIKFIQDNLVTLDSEFSIDVVDKNPVPSVYVCTCEFDIQVSYGDEVEEFKNLSLNAKASNFVTKVLTKSELINVNVTEEFNEIKKPYELFAEGREVKGQVILTLNGGFDGSLDKLNASCFIGTDNGPGKRTGMKAFEDNDEVSLMAVPGVTNSDVQVNLIAHCENKANRFAILDIPQSTTNVNELKTYRDMFDTSYAACYHPWLKVFDPLDKRSICIPPSGSVMGIYARVDNTRGVHKAPANETLRGCTGLDVQYNKGEQDILNPIGVNLIRSFTGAGIKVWGARTLSSNPAWKYINIRRLFIYLEESVKRNTDWVVFEPNDMSLWARVKSSLEYFLTGVWRSGALAGTAASEAFFVKIDTDTMTQDDIDNGRLICVIGVAPVKPAEFVIFRFTQFTQESNG